MLALSMLVVILPEDKLPKEENTRQLYLLFYFNTEYAGNITGTAKLNTLSSKHKDLRPPFNWGDIFAGISLVQLGFAP